MRARQDLLQVSGCFHMRPPLFVIRSHRHLSTDSIPVHATAVLSARESAQANAPSLPGSPSNAAPSARAPLSTLPGPPTAGGTVDQHATYAHTRTHPSTPNQHHHHHHHQTAHTVPSNHKHGEPRHGLVVPLLPPQLELARQSLRTFVEFPPLRPSLSSRASSSRCACRSENRSSSSSSPCNSACIAVRSSR